MSSAFIPLLPDTKAPSVRNLTATANEGGGPGNPGFAALIPDSAPAAPRTLRAEAAPAPSHDRLPVVTLKRDGDKVTRIQVRCSCGELVELDCVY
jgi:hypothetical protein